MMFNQVPKIENVGDFIPWNTSVFTIQHVKDIPFICNYNELNFQLIWKVECLDYFGFKIIDKQIFVYDNMINTESYDIENGSRIKEFINWSLIDFQNNNFLVDNKESKCIELVSQEDRLIWSVNLQLSYPNLFVKNLLFSVKSFFEKKIMFCIDCLKGELLWHFTLESLHQAYEGFSKKWDRPMEIANFCGVAHEVLWMDVVCRGIGNFLLGLDVHTGQPVHLLDKAENRFERYPFDMIPTDGRTTYDAKRNILFGFAPDWVHWQVDLSEELPKIKMWDLTEEVTPRNAYVSAYMNCGISDSHVFFPVGSLGSTPQVFALNRETLKVDWQYYFTEGGQYFTPTKIEVTDTHLYVLDNTGTLHIFDKTEDN